MCLPYVSYSVMLYGGQVQGSLPTIISTEGASPDNPKPETKETQ